MLLHITHYHIYHQTVTFIVNVDSYMSSTSVAVSLIYHFLSPYVFLQKGVGLAGDVYRRETGNDPPNPTDTPVTRTAAQVDPQDKRAPNPP